MQEPETKVEAMSRARKQLDGRLLARDAMIAPNGRIQSTGADVCVDLRCVCGYFGHYHGDFLYFWRCPSCQMPYAVGQHVQLFALNADDAAIVAQCLSFKECELEEDED